MRVLNAAQMREADRRTIEEIGIPSLVLMENAGRQVVAALETTHPDLSGRRVAVLCGRGNNGGDGLVVARTLRQRGADVLVFVLSHITQVRGDARMNLEILGRLGVKAVEVADSETWERHRSEVTSSALIVDAILGTGLSAPVEGHIRSVIRDVNASGLPVVSIDVPSGLSVDSVEPIGESIEADLTVTLAAPKPALVLPPTQSRVGRLVIADVGIPAAVLDGVGGPRIELLTRTAMAALIRPRPLDSHKGDYGRVLVVAGSRGKTGAAHLAARGALTSGAGLVTVALPADCQPVVAAMAPEYMTEALDERDGGLDPASVERVLAMPRDVIAIGPGLGQAPATRQFVKGLLDRATGPVVIDADGLNAFCEESERLAGRQGRDVIVTPHPGEMGRLLGRSADEVQARRLEMAGDFAGARQVYVVLKGYRTIIATPDKRIFINPTGNPGMATGGTGDVLTGMLAAWVGQLRDVEAACKVAVYLHGRAGDLAASAEGEVAMTASDLIAHLGDAVRELTVPRKTDQLGQAPSMPLMAGSWP